VLSHHHLLTADYGPNTTVTKACPARTQEQGSLCFDHHAVCNGAVWGGEGLSTVISEPLTPDTRPGAWGISTQITHTCPLWAGGNGWGRESPGFVTSQEAKARASA
jgi:hypothetical protein